MFRQNMNDYRIYSKTADGFSPVNLSDKLLLGSFLQHNAFFLQEIAKILQKVQEMQDLGRFLQETSDLFIFPARNFVC